MKAGGGKLKGAQFERDICKKLSTWVSNGKRDDVFWRSAMSGGRATVGQKTGIKRDSQVGDISSIDPLGTDLLKTFYIECKFYQDFHWAAYMLKQSGTLHKIWVDLCKRAFDPIVDKIPMLVGKQNKYPAFIMIPPFEGLPETRMVFQEDKWDWAITGVISPLECFLEQMKSDELVQLYSRGLYKNLMDNSHAKRKK